MAYRLKIESCTLSTACIDIGLYLTHATRFNFRYSEGGGKDGQGKIDENDESDNEMSFYENVPNNSNDPILRPRNRQGLRRASGGSENDRVRYVVSHKTVTPWIREIICMLNILT